MTGIVGKVHVGPGRVYPWTERYESPTRNVQWVAERTHELFLKAKEAQQPFHITVGFMDPHRDNTRGGFANDAVYPGVKDITYDPASIRVPPYLPDLPAVRQEMAEYYRSISRMDQGVGMVLDHLKQAGMYDDTAIFFVSDNGPPFINSKTTCLRCRRSPTSDLSLAGRSSGCQSGHGLLGGRLADDAGLRTDHTSPLPRPSSTRPAPFFPSSRATPRHPLGPRSTAHTPSTSSPTTTPPAFSAHDATSTTETSVGSSTSPSARISTRRSRGRQSATPRCRRTETSREAS